LLDVEPKPAPLPLFACVRLDPVVPVAGKFVAMAQRIFCTI